MIVHRLGPDFHSTIAEWWRVWAFAVYYDGRWNWSAVRAGAAWTLLVGPWRVSNAKIHHCAPTA